MLSVKHIQLVITMLVLMTVLVACQGTERSDDASSDWPSFLNIGTAGTGGAYYPIGITVGEIINADLGINASAQVTGGAGENVTLTQNGEVDLAITQGPMAVAGYNGTDPYNQKHENISLLFNGMSKGIFQLVVLESSGIQSVEDLKNKRVVLGPAGGGAINVISDILSVYDMDISDLQGTYVSYSEGITMLTDQNVDAVIVQSAAPSSAITELAASRNHFRVISIEPDKQEELLSTFHYLDSIVLPKEMYGTEEDIHTVFLTNLMIVDRNLNEDFVYNLTKALFENLEKIQNSHPSAQELSLEGQAMNPPIPLHPGAERYYREMGVIE